MYFVSTLIVLLIFSASCMAGQPPGVPKTTAPNTPAKKSRAERIKTEALEKLELALDETRLVENIGARVQLTVAITELLFRKHPDKCRKALESLLQDCIRLRLETSDQKTLKDLDLDSAARTIVQAAAKIDHKFSQSLLDKYSEDGIADSKQVNRDRLARNKFYLSVASRLIDQDPALAASAAQTVIGDVVLPESLVFLRALQGKNSETANRLFELALHGVESRRGLDVNELLLLFSFVFCPRQIPTITTQGLGTFYLPGEGSLNQCAVDVPLARQYLGVTAGLLSDPIRYDRRVELQPEFGAAGDWFLVKMIETPTLTYRADLIDRISAQQLLLEGLIQNRATDASASLERWQKSAQTNPAVNKLDSVEDLVAGAERANNTKRRDQLLFRAAMAAIRVPYYDKAVEIAEKISSDYRKQAKELIDFDAASAAALKGDIERTLRFADKDDDLLRRSYVLTLIAKTLVERNSPDLSIVRNLLSSVEALLPRFSSDKDRVSALTGAATIYSRFDKTQAAILLHDAVLYANKSNDFTGDIAVSRGFDIAGLYFDYSLYTNFSFDEVFSALGLADFERTAEAAGELQSRPLRLRTTIAICRSVLAANT
jgi:hypothetical protein